MPICSPTTPDARKAEPIAALGSMQASEGRNQ